MKRYIGVLTHCVLFIATCNAWTVRTSADNTHRLLAVASDSGKLDITCTVEDSDAPSSIIVSWYRSVEGGERVLLKSHKNLTMNGNSLHITEMNRTRDAGNYTCVFLPTAQRSTQLEATVEVIANASVIIKERSINHKEGHDLAIHCRLIGRPIRTVYWTKDFFPIKEIIRDPSRMTLKTDDKGFPNTSLTMTGLRLLEDGGDYCCHATNIANAASDCVIVRVKSKNAAIWPMIGIAAEVLLLMTIILFSESRRAKPDMDEHDLDTDDDKTQPQGQTEGEVRQRK